MVNRKIERKEVVEPCLKLCKQLLGTHILQYRRLDALDAWHINGSPDIEIWVPKDNFVWILMPECKKPVGGIISKSQIEYRDRYKKFNNVIYMIITNVSELKNLIFNTSSYGCDLLGEFNGIKEL